MDARARPRSPLVWTVALLSTIGYGAIYYLQPLLAVASERAFIAPAVGRQMARPVNLVQTGPDAAGHQAAPRPEWRVCSVARASGRVRFLGGGHPATRARAYGSTGNFCR